jgi:hypothetical protein
MSSCSNISLTDYCLHTSGHAHHGNGVRLRERRRELGAFDGVPTAVASDIQLGGNVDLILLFTIFVLVNDVDWVGADKLNRQRRRRRPRRSVIVCKFNRRCVCSRPCPDSFCIVVIGAGELLLCDISSSFIELIIEVVLLFVEIFISCIVVVLVPLIMLVKLLL